MQGNPSKLLGEGDVELSFDCTSIAPLIFPIVVHHLFMLSIFYTLHSNVVQAI